MQAKDIERYLTQLGQELVHLGVQQPFRVLLIGGAYMMLLANAPRSTDDINIFWLEDEETLQQALRALRDGVRIVAQKNALEPNWLNYLTHLLMYDQITIPKGKLWRRYGPLHETVSYHGIRRWEVQTGKPPCQGLGHFLHSFLTSASPGRAAPVSKNRCRRMPYAHLQRRTAPSGRD